MTQLDLYLTPEETGQLLERDIDTVLETLPTITLPGNGPVIPTIAVPPFARVSEEDV